jgi:molecular chaperone HtpG
MSAPDPSRAPLLHYLHAESEDYHAKARELRASVEGWLGYVTASFTHYTQHTIKHSDEIILQVSKLLFRNDDPGRPVVPLSPVEAYIVVAAAYLHDAGMVISDEEKRRILESAEWQRWTADDPGVAFRLAEIEALRTGDDPPQHEVRNFLADRQIRFLIAEFVRRTHHARASDLLREHQAELGRFAYDDPILERAIGNVCLGHGLTERELDDDERFPDQTDIRGEKANLRFLAILLRLGDLLDLSSDRACPLLLRAASPLPSDSIAHWTQYQRIILRETDPEYVKLVAECETQEEHRYLHDWCQWLEEEVSAARGIMVRCRRHTSWQPPYVRVGDATSIIIRPSSTSTYEPVNWRLQLDHDAVFERLTYNLYTQPLAFVRELLQNALDATRCRLYAEMREAGESPPPSPTKAPADRLRMYPIQVSASTVRRFNELSQQEENRQLITIEDVGLGMDRRIVQDYFLQVGRSYYATDEFRRSFEFAPTSRFGLGFLSVFGASDNVVVETLRRGSEASDGLRLTLTGPRSYLLTERTTRANPGTRIAVLLNDPIEQGDLTRALKEWCRRVEFPVDVDDFGGKERLEAESSSLFVYEEPDLTSPGSTLGVRAFPIDRAGIEGEIYVFLHNIHDVGESWADWWWATNRYRELHPAATGPRFPEALVCIHGITLTGAGYFSGGPVSARLDYRRPVEALPLSREATVGNRALGLRDPEVASRLANLVREHLDLTPLAKGDEGWRYKQRLMRYFELPFPFWLDEQATVLAMKGSEKTQVSLREATAWPTLTVIVPSRERDGDPGEPEADPDSWCLTEKVVNALSEDARVLLFKPRHVANLRSLPGGHLAFDWTLEGDPVPRIGTRSQIADVIDLEDDDIIAIRIHKAAESTYDHAVMNAGHPLVQWLLRVQDACREHVAGLDEEKWNVLIGLLKSPAWYFGLQVEELAQYLERWNDLLDLPPELRVPDVELTTQQFRSTKSLFE